MSDTGIIIAEHGNLKLSLDLIEIDDRSGAVYIEIELRYVSGRQELVYRRAGSWIGYRAIDSFGESLRHGNLAVLINLSDYPILDLRGNDSGYWLTINPASTRESREAKELSVKVAVDTAFHEKLRDAIYEFPKWW